MYDPTYMICPKYLNSETESRFLIARGQVREEWGVTINNYKVSFCGDENVLELELIADHCTTVNILKKSLNCTVQRIKCVTCELDLQKAVFFLLRSNKYIKMFKEIISQAILGQSCDYLFAPLYYLNLQ